MPDSHKTVPSSLADILHRHANVNAISANWLSVLRQELCHPRFPDRARSFRTDLANAILHSTITPEHYEKLTSEDFDTQEGVNARLREIWRGIFGDGPIREE
jgi:hypothetical protein